MRNLNSITNKIKTDIKTNKTPLTLLALYCTVTKIIFNTLCPLKITTGFPCPGCGLTRAIYSLATLHPARALQYNPTAPLWLLLIIHLAIQRYIKEHHNIKATKILLACTCLTTLIVYAYRMLNNFPTTPPMTYDPNNLITKILTIYNH